MCSSSASSASTSTASPSSSSSKWSPSTTSAGHFYRPAHPQHLNQGFCFGNGWNKTSKLVLGRDKVKNRQVVLSAKIYILMREQRGLTRIWQSSNCWGRITKYCIKKGFAKKTFLTFIYYLWQNLCNAMMMAGITDGAFCFKNHNRSWFALLSLQVTSNAMWLVFRSDFMMCHNISKMLWQRCDNLTGFAQHRSHKLFLADVERLHPVDEMSMWWFQENGHH